MTDVLDGKIGPHTVLTRLDRANWAPLQLLMGSVALGRRRTSPLVPAQGLPHSSTCGSAAGTRPAGLRERSLNPLRAGRNTFPRSTSVMRSGPRAVYSAYGGRDDSS